MSFRTTTLRLFLGGFTAPLVAQSTVQAPELMALTNTTPLVLRQGLGTINCRASHCSLNGILPGGGSSLAGGSAWDSRQSRLWVSNGRHLMLTGARDTTTACGVACRPFLAPLLTLTSANLVTGLAFVAAGLRPSLPAQNGVLFLSYYNQYLAWAVSRGCALSPASSCSLARLLGTSRRIGGLAADGTRGFLFVATARTGTTSPANVIYVAKLDQPCVPLCKFAIVIDSTKCSKVRLGPITGLAYDAAHDQLYVTDGRSLVYGKLAVSRTTSGWACRFAHLGCCTNLNTEAMVGLAVASPAPLGVGTSCTTGGCETCPTMRNGVVGDAVLGNMGLRLTLRHAPTNYQAALLGIGFGPCSTRGVNIGLCGPIRVAFAPVPPVIIGIPGPGTGTGCNGQVLVPAAIPVDRALLDLRLSTQWVLLCPNGGHATTNCLQLRIGG